MLQSKYQITHSLQLFISLHVGMYKKSCCTALVTGIGCSIGVDGSSVSVSNILKICYIC